MAASDYVLVCAALTPETRGIVDEAALRAMNKTAVILNLGRGPLIVEQGLIRALEEGWIRGAALDVFDQEPLPAGHPFYDMEQVLLSPHCADNFAGWADLSMRLFIENFHRFLAGEPLRNIVDKSKGY
jgi:phosphoglycerate dehydrogenase-like enzyme